MRNQGVVAVKRKSGRHQYWDARWFCTETQKRRSRTLGRCDRLSERQARKLAVQMEAEFEADPQARSHEGPPTLGQWLDLYLARLEGLGRKPTTLKENRATRSLLIAYFGEQRRLDRITKFDLEQMRLRLSMGKLITPNTRKRKQPPGPTTVSKYTRQIKAVFKAAYEDNLIPRNPSAGLKVLPPPASPWHKVDGEEFAALYAAANEEVFGAQRARALRLLLALCRLAALRRRDALELTWDKVRLREGVLVFRPQKVERFAKRDARVPIGLELQQILEEARGDALRIDGRLIPPGVLPQQLGRSVFPKLFAEAGLSIWDKPLHTLRKSCIDDWARVAPPNVVMEWATHSSLQTTHLYYTKVNPADEQIGRGAMFGGGLLAEVG